MFGRPRWLAIGVPALSLLAASCGLGPKVLVVVELQTDLVPQIEFTQVRTVVGDEEVTQDVEETTFIRPARVAELQASPGTVDVRVQLLDVAGIVRAERLVIAEVRRDTGVVVFISASCRGVTCRGSTNTCIDGMCQDARSVCGGEACEPGDDCVGSECDVRFCPRGVCDNECVDTTDCSTIDPCSDPVCESSVCVGVARPGACPPGFFCAIGIGCIDIPSGFLDGGVPDGSVADGGVEYCTTCVTNCGTPGLGVCDMGFPTGECVPPDEYCNGQDEDCDTLIDEGLACDHEHGIVCEVGRRPIPGTMETEPNVADTFEGGGPGLICAGAGCAPALTNCRTLRGGFDAHVHSVSFGGSGSFTIEDDVPFSISATVGSASGHTHGARCGLGTSSIEVEGGLAFHRILPMGSDTEDMPAGRYDYFCLPPVGDPATDCYPAFGFCETN